MKDPKITVGSVVFGPLPYPGKDEEEARIWASRMQISSTQAAIPCNCRGPQTGQTKCPCMLVAEANHGQKMIEDGVTICGQKFRLVPA